MLGTIAIGILMLSMVRMLLVLQSGAGLAESFMRLAKLTALFVPHYLGFMLPLSLFVGIYLVLRRLSLDSELVSLFACGMSFARFILPLFVLGGFVTAANTFVLGWLEPHSRYSYREMMFRLEYVAPYLAIREGVFTTIGRQTIHVEHIDKEKGTLDKIFFFELAEDGTQTEITAARGEFFVGGGLPVLRLRDGNRLITQQRPLPEDGKPDVSAKLEFQVLTFPLTAPSVGFRGRGKDEQEFSLYGLYEKQNSPPPGTSPAEMASEFHRKLAIILTSLFLPLLGAFLAQSNPRGSNLYQGVFSFGIIVLYQQLVQFGSVLTDKTGLSPAVTIWPWFGILAGGSFFALALQDRMPGRPAEQIASALHRLSRRRRTTWQAGH